MSAAFTHPKILHGKSLDERLADLRRQSKTLVFTNGCFDLLHPGHADFLSRARTFGDALLLALNDDASVRRLNKGPDRPISPLQARMYTAAHLECVDIVTSFTEDTPLECIRRTQPQVLAKGGDWPVERIAGRKFVEDKGGLVVSLPLLPGWSTTALLERIRKPLP